VVASLKKALEKEGAFCKGHSTQTHVEIRIPKEHQHYWSPYLQVDVVAAEEGTGSLIKGVYGPRPAVWTLFIFGYAIIIFFSFVGGMYGLTQWGLDMPATGFLAIPVGVVLFLALFMIAQGGQRIGRDQVQVLDDFFHEALGLEPEIVYDGNA
jgi:hypothetical protein